MENQRQDQGRVKIEVEIRAETLSTLESMADAFKVSIGEAIDQLSDFYKPSQKERILTELSGLLDDEDFKHI